LPERREDIPRLATHLITLAAKKLGLSAPRVTEQQCEQLKNYDWPGNVRELQNLLERAVILSKGGTLHLDPSWFPKASTSRVPCARRQVLRSCQTTSGAAGNVRISKQR
jgi:DNA-binding NtrC family response regulator